jgi:hypothetical protein
MVLIQRFKWVDDCKFDIEFIESNNITRKNYSKQGEKYRYEILGETAHYYLMLFEFQARISIWHLSCIISSKGCVIRPLLSIRAILNTASNTATMVATV